MRRLRVFNQVSLDGFFADADGDMSWAHKNDAEWKAFGAENASGTSVLVFGRVTYEMMAQYWPSAAARKNDPGVAKGMNSMSKIVFSRTLAKPAWENTKVVKGETAAVMRKLKAEPGPDLLILGSGTLVSKLTAAGLIDGYQLVVNPIVLGAGRTLFEDVEAPVDLKLKKTRAFKNGNVVLWYER